MFKYLSIPIFAALTLGSYSVTSYASNQSEWQLKKVVTLSRHGVRPQTNTQKLNQATGLNWPKFGVEDGHLSGHGYTGMWQQGRFMLEEWQREGLQLQSSGACPLPNQLFVWASPYQRIKATGKALTDGMFPGCGIAPLAVNTQYDPMMEIYHLGLSHPDQSVMRKQILERMGSPEQAKARYERDVKHLRETVCSPDSCQFLDKPWGIHFKSTGKPALDGPAKVGSTIGETVRLQYSENLPLDQVAFGHVRNASDVKDLMALHAAQYNLALTTPEFAAHNGSLLMRQIISAMTAGTKQHQNWLGDARLERPLVMLIGHDSNIAEIQTMLQFFWQLNSYPKNDIPPGGTLSFSRFHNTLTNQNWVRIRFSALSLDQWRTLAPLNQSDPLQFVDLEYKGCQQTSVGTLCPLDKTIERASHMLIDSPKDIAVFKQ